MPLDRGWRTWMTDRECACMRDVTCHVLNGCRLDRLVVCIVSIMGSVWEVSQERSYVCKHTLPTYLTTRTLSVLFQFLSNHIWPRFFSLPPSSFCKCSALFLIPLKSHFVQSSPCHTFIIHHPFICVSVSSSLVHSFFGLQPPRQRMHDCQNSQEMLHIHDHCI